MDWVDVVLLIIFFKIHPCKWKSIGGIHCLKRPWARRSFGTIPLFGACGGLEWINYEIKEFFTKVEVGDGNLKVLLLQFTDDTVLFLRDNVAIVFTLKAILRYFELASDLKVNCYKSSLVGVHVEQRKVFSIAKILNCTTMTIPFVYSRLSVGENARKIGTWQPVIDKMRRILTPWRRKHLSFGRRICFIKIGTIFLIQLY